MNVCVCVCACVCNNLLARIEHIEDIEYMNNKNKNK